MRAYGQRDPLIEYKNEAFKIFDELMVNIKSEICHNIFRSASSLMAFEQFFQNLPQHTVHRETSAFGKAGGGAAADGNGDFELRRRDLESQRRDVAILKQDFRATDRVGAEERA